jgi:alpha-N-arabinofuranosidase
MRKKTFAHLLPIATLLASSLISAPAQTTSATLTIHPEQAITPVSPMLYGLMTEEINYSYDGGLYAEMVRNRTFHGDWSGIQSWYLVEDGNSVAKMSDDKTTGPSTALPTSLKIEISQADGRNQAGVLNTGWWGMALRPNTTYDGSFYAKGEPGATAPLTVSLISDNTGHQLATASIPPLTKDWKRYSFKLKTGAMQSSSANHLSITASHRLIMIEITASAST